MVKMSERDNWKRGNYGIRLMIKNGLPTHPKNPANPSSDNPGSDK